MNFIAWIHAFRLRTLPLALSSILMGIIISSVYGAFRLDVSILAIITTLFLQILSNLANDYGDGIKGTDNENRLGPVRTVQSGKISLLQMKIAIIIFSILSFLSGIILIWISEINIANALLFFGLGILAIISSIKYTVGKGAYGYYGLGDLFVFIFFGLLAVIGTFYLNSGYFIWQIIFPAITMGLLSLSVLNLNNIRDIENDRIHGKNTIAVKLGEKGAKLYHTIVVNISFFSLLYFVYISNLNWWVYFTFLIYPLFFNDLLKIDRERNLQKLDPFLKKTAIKTMILVFLFGLLILI